MVYLFTSESVAAGHPLSEVRRIQRHPAPRGCVVHGMESIALVSRVFVHARYFLASAGRSGVCSDRGEVVVSTVLRGRHRSLGSRLRRGLSTR